MDTDNTRLETLRHGKRFRPMLCLLTILGLLAMACSSTTNDGVEQSAEFTVEGVTATMTGVIDSSTPAAVRSLLADNPEVVTIIMQDVPGSADDEANLEASRLIRAAGLGTHLNADGQVASGGVDFYLAGSDRTFDEGASFGVHSWADGNGTEGKDIPEDDPQHRLYLDYYDEIGISEDFYWFTLEAAPAADIHFMTAAELQTYGFATSR